MYNKVTKNKMYIPDLSGMKNFATNFQKYICLVHISFQTY